MAEQDGVVSRLDALEVGLLVRDMGGGRTVKTDVIDPAVGVVLQAKVGDAVHAGESLAILHIREKDAGRAEEFAARLRAAYRVDASAPISVTPSPVLSVLS
jgi:pyrimidine-nucleoside phosphorylase